MKRCLLALVLLAGPVQGQTITDLQTALTAAQNALTTARTQLTAAATSGTAVQAQILSLTNQVATLQTSVTSLITQLTAAQTQATADAATIAALKAQVSSLQAQIAAIPPCTLSCPLPPPPPVVTPPPPPVNTSVALSWTPNLCPDPNGAQCTTGYRVYWGTASGVYNQAKGAGLSTTGTTFTVTNLTPGFTYFFAVTAQNSQAESGFSNEVSVPLGVVTPPPTFTESPTGTKDFVIGTDKIIDSKGAVWTLGPKDPTVEGGVETTVLRNGTVKGTAIFLCYSNHQVAAFSKGTGTNGSWYVYSDTLNFFQILSPAVPVGCV